jgi:hypothetical protein
MGVEKVTGEPAAAKGFTTDSVVVAHWRTTASSGTTPASPGRPASSVSANATYSPVAGFVKVTVGVTRDSTEAM